MRFGQRRQRTRRSRHRLAFLKDEGQVPILHADPGGPTLQKGGLPIRGSDDNGVTVGLRGGKLDQRVADGANVGARAVPLLHSHEQRSFPQEKLVSAGEVFVDGPLGTGQCFELRRGVRDDGCA
jgi:hypothetical protein